MQAFREDTEAWLVEPMFAVVHNLRTVACQADDETRRLGRKSDVLENCGRQLVNCFSTAAQASGKHIWSQPVLLFVSCAILMGANSQKH